MVDNKNNNYNYELATRYRGKLVLPKNDPIFSDPKALKQLESLYGPGNIIALDENEFLKWAAENEFLSTIQAEYSTPLDYIDQNQLPEVPTNIKLPPPTNLKVFGKSFPSKTAGLVSQTFVFDAIPNANVSYDSLVFTTIQPLPVAVENPVITPSYPEVRVSFQTVQNALSYVLTITNTSTKAFESIVIVPSSAAAQSASGQFTGVPHGSYTLKITPYNTDGISGKITTSGVFTV